MLRTNNACDDPYLQNLNCVDFAPVFITGLHRSGTTILYKLLSESGAFNTCTVHHVVYRYCLLYLHLNVLEAQAKEELEQQLESLEQRSRGFDTIGVSAETPEEYCYALAHQGRRPMLNDENFPSFLEFCKKLQFIQSRDKSLLLKNPFDSANFLYIKDRLPDSRFVFIHRHPVEVINSQVKAVWSLLKRKNEYVALIVERYRQLWEHPGKLWLARKVFSERLPFIVPQVVSNVSRENQRLLTDIGRLPEESYIHVTYSQLCDDPNNRIAEILDFLQVTPAQRPDSLAHIKKRPVELAPGVAKRIPQILRKNSAYCKRFGLGQSYA